MVSDQNGIYLTKKQASITATTLVILGLLFFVAGYFWGKQSVIDGFTQKTSQESFNDQVDYLLTMQSFAAKNGGISPLTTGEEKEEDVQELLQGLPDAAEENQEQTVQSRPVVVNAVAQQPAKKGKHFAALAGFAKKSMAEQMVARLKKRHIEVVLKTKTSKSASGKAQKVWYQVVTQSYDSVQEVQDVIDKILRSEKIKRSDIKIV